MRTLALAAALIAAPAHAGFNPRPDYSTEAPAGWRQSIEGPFSLFVPPALLRVGPKKFDSIAGKFSGPGLLVDYDYGYYVPECADGDAARIGGRSVEITRAAGEGGSVFLQLCFAAPGRGAKRLTIRAEAASQDDADDAMKAFGTIRFIKVR